MEKKEVPPFTSTRLVSCNQTDDFCVSKADSSLHKWILLSSRYSIFSLLPFTLIPLWQSIFTSYSNIESAAVKHRSRFEAF